MCGHGEQPHSRVDDGDRARDLVLGKHVLYQLSYVHTEPTRGTDPLASCLPSTRSAIELRGHAFRELESDQREPSSKPGVDAVNHPGSEPPTRLERVACPVQKGRSAR